MTPQAFDADNESNSKTGLLEKETAMILNLEQQKAVVNGEPVSLNVAGTECVLLRKDVYLRMDPEYDSGPWTTEEMNLLADEAEAIISQNESHEH